MNNKIKNDQLTESEAIGFLIMPIVTTIAQLFIELGLKSVTIPYKKTGDINEKLSKMFDKKMNIKIYIFEKEKTIANGFMMLSGKVYLTKRLIEILSDREIMAVILHEYNHFKKHHLLKNKLYYYSGAYLITQLITLTVMPLYIILFVIWNISLNVTVGRRMEIQSDQFAAQYGYKKELISALDKIGKNNSKKEVKKSKIDKLIYKLYRLIDEHPEFQTRVEKILVQPIKVNLNNLKETKVKVFKFLSKS